MSEFKVGDKVRVLKRYSLTTPYNERINKIFTIIKIIPCLIYIDVPHEEWSDYHSDEIELVGRPQEDKPTQSEISAKRIIEVTIKGNTFQLTYEEACSLHNVLEESGV